MRILQLISSAGNYGAENMLLTLAQALEEKQSRIQVGIFHNAHNPNLDIAQHARRLGLETQLFACNGRVDRVAVRDIERHIAAQSIDVLHTHGYKADLYGFLASRGCRVSLIATCHNWPDRTPALWAYSVADRFVLRKFPAVAAVSPDVVRALRRFAVPAEKISLIPNGIDLKLYEHAAPSLRRNPLYRDALIVGIVGRLVPAKGGELLLKAAKEILEKLPGTRFVFVGEGPARQNLEARARRLSIQANVAFLGRRDDLPEIYASLDVLAQPSYVEGMPLVVLEALAAQRSVVATGVGAVPELVRNNETGLLIEPGDVSALRDAILLLLGDAQLRQKLGKNGRALVERHHSSAAMAENYLRLYEQLLQQPESLPTTPRNA